VNGRLLPAPCYRVGPLAHLLTNRCYLGEVVYRGEVHKDQHAPIVDLDLFEAVQERLRDGAVERSRNPAIVAFASRW
jgi:hypothetical protein